MLKISLPSKIINHPITYLFTAFILSVAHYFLTGSPLYF
ncbi:Uncharacterised protein [Klebsiella pneumoniae]|nr:hypothetical protein F8B39_02310 [Klebsiella pneumoniae]ROG08870.1 hypothetical protein C4Y63_021180 [Klebsiella pneumoniae subsp. pneumoniae]MBW5573367.1 hypothetical protein [Klebsiella pneumoniae]RYI13116.1 hypothetical protein EVY38_27160 [Klebsiella pneumoniae]TDA79120.1 hypothetical protein E1H97_13080 [Klebsiella pneumoniae]